MSDKHYDTLLELRKKGEPFVQALVVRREAPSSGKAGDKALVKRNGELIGWIGGGCVKGIVLKESLDAIKTGKPRLLRIGKYLDNQQNQQGVKEYKMTCQSEGTVEIFIEPFLPKPHLVVMGKTEIAKALVKLAKAIGYKVTGVAADANLQTYEKVDELITRYQLDAVQTTPSSFIVVATQGDQDEKALEEALKKTAAFVGFVASRKKIQSISNYLKDAGCDPAKIEAIRSPVGVDINAKQPDEVALSILAEIIQVKNSLEVLTADEPLSSMEKPAGVPDYYINPVCGVPVDKNNPKHIREFEGEKVYFCCDGCTVKFDKDPAKYIHARNLGLEPEGM